MSNAARHVLKVTEVLLQRSKEALKAFVAGDEDLALTWLKSRDVGFMNLRTAEWHASKEGYDMARDPQAMSVIGSILELDNKLVAALGAAKSRANLDLQRVKRIRQRVGKYHSGAQQGARFEKTV